MHGSEDAHVKIHAETGELHKLSEEAAHLAHVLTPITELFQHMTGASRIAGQEVSELARILGHMHSPVMLATGAITGLIGVMGALAEYGAKMGSALKEAATGAGTTTENYQGLKFAMEQSGASVQLMNRALIRIEQAQAKAAAASEDHAKNLKELQKILDEAGKHVDDFAEKLRKAARERAFKLGEGGISFGLELRNFRERQDKEIADFEKKNEYVTLGDRAEIRKKFEQQEFEMRRKHAEELAKERREYEHQLAEQMREMYKQQYEDLKKYNDAIAEQAEKAATESAGKFEKFHIKLLEAGKAIDPVKVYREIAEEIEKIPDAAGRAAKAIELFGPRLGAKLVESLQEGKKGLTELFDEAEKLGIILSEQELKIAKKFEDSSKKLESVVQSTMARIGLAFAPAFQKLTDAVSEALGTNSKKIGEWAKSIAAYIEPVFADIAAAIEGHFEHINSTVIGGAARVVRDFAKALSVLADIAEMVGKIFLTAFGSIGELMKAAFGVDVTTDVVRLGIEILIAAKAVTFITGTVRVLAVAIKGLVLATGPWGLALRLVVAAIMILAPVIEEYMPKIKAWFMENLNIVIDKIKAFIKWVKEAADAVRKFFGYDTAESGHGEGGHAAPEGGIGAGHVGNMEGASQYGNPLSATAGMPTEEGHGTGHQHGGLIFGRSGDRNVIRAEGGEYVVRKSAVDRVGVGFLDGINQMGYALGGLVDFGGMRSPPLRFASGGMVPAAASARTPITLNIGGQSMGPMMADDRVAQHVVRYSMGAQMKSAGPKPSWHGSR